MNQKSISSSFLETLLSHTSPNGYSQQHDPITFTINLVTLVRHVHSHPTKQPTVSHFVYIYINIRNRQSVLFFFSYIRSGFRFFAHAPQLASIKCVKKKKKQRENAVSKRFFFFFFLIHRY